MADIEAIRALAAMLAAHLGALRHDQRGYSTEAVVVTAALATLALVVVGIIAYKVTQQANGIQTH
jgi:cell division protein ZapA (FtsZ GTPase activity inhibitor)